jgi:Mn2+/Fe2+ NRAMP family transporter
VSQPPQLLTRLGRVGPGLAIAATGVGAGDLIAASVAGLRFGTALAWAVLLGAVLKYVLNEGIARWQLGEDRTVLSAVVERFPRWVTWYLAVYFVLWTAAVAAGLAAACGIAAATLWPVLSPAGWGILHSLLAAGVVLVGGYPVFERAMKGFIAVMFLSMVGSALWLGPDWTQVGQGVLLPTIPAGSIFMVLSIMGGVGGSVTLLAYGAWIREKGWRGRRYLSIARTDLAVAYILTGLFGVAVLVVASTLAASGEPPGTGTGLLIGMGDVLGGVLGNVGKVVFLVGVWAAVFTSMLGTWHGVPALFADFLRAWRKDPEPQGRDRLAGGLVVGVALLAMALVPLGRPLWLILAYTVTGSLFMPFLAFVLLRLNSVRGPLGRELGYGIASRAILWATLVMFAWLGATQVQKHWPQLMAWLAIGH